MVMSIALMVLLMKPSFSWKRPAVNSPILLQVTRQAHTVGCLLNAIPSFPPEGTQSLFKYTCTLAFSGPVAAVQCGSHEI